MSRVSYYYNNEIGSFYYGPAHPMKPLRIKITHEIIKSYDLLPRMQMLIPEKHEEFVQMIDFTKFHSDEYVDFLNMISPETMKLMTEQLLYFNIGEDCPIFEGLSDYCKMYTVGSVLGAYYLNNNFSETSINWSGGLHHAKKNEASGFCYINDCVLAILELLTKHQRVLYIDIDVHHGDGVEEAFFATDRVLTCSFHKYGDFFPGSGGLNDIGWGKGKYSSVNFPLLEGMDDLCFERIFKATITNIMEKFKPQAIVLQCGSDSLSGDRLGTFNLSVRGHGSCVKFIRSLNLPLLVLGGGGYTLRNVPRCWAYETGLLLGMELDDEMPKHDYLEYFYPEYRLHTSVTNMDNLNTDDYLNNILETIDNNLKQLNLSTLQLNLNKDNSNPSILAELNLKEMEQDAYDKNPDHRFSDSTTKMKKNYMDM